MTVLFVFHFEQGRIVRNRRGRAAVLEEGCEIEVAIDPVSVRSLAAAAAVNQNGQAKNGPLRATRRPGRRP